MNRKFKKYKRNIKKEPYREDLKNKMNIENFPLKEYPYPIFFNESNINKSLQKDIFSLPKELQKNIYLFTMKAYWKKKVIDTPLHAIWHESVAYMNNQKGKCLFNNVHFMHLECNTLESKKEYIPGCQCNFCLKEDIESINKHSNHIVNDYLYFLEMIHCYDDIPNFWNLFQQVYITTDNITKLKIYDPFMGSCYGNIMNTYFS